MGTAPQTALPAPAIQTHEPTALFWSPIETQKILDQWRGQRSRVALSVKNNI